MADDEPQQVTDEVLQSLRELRFDGIRIGSEPVWADRLAEIAGQLPPEVLQDLAGRARRALGDRMIDFATFSTQHGLTPAEMLLVESVSEGRSVPEHAEAAGISVNTARVHMQRVLEKTGSHRQTDLLRMLLARQ